MSQRHKRLEVFPSKAGQTVGLLTSSGACGSQHCLFLGSNSSRLSFLKAAKQVKSSKTRQSLFSYTPSKSKKWSSICSPWKGVFVILLKVDPSFCFIFSVSLVLLLPLIEAKHFIVRLQRESPQVTIVPDAPNTPWKGIVFSLIFFMNSLPTVVKSELTYTSISRDAYVHLFVTEWIRIKPMSSSLDKVMQKQVGNRSGCVEVIMLALIWWWEASRK